MNKKNRAEVIDRQFVDAVSGSDFPKPITTTSPEDASLSPPAYIELFESQIISRHLDLLARILRLRNESFYTIGSAGHEGNAAVAPAFRLSDMAFLHYRSGAFFTQRAKQLPGSTPVYDMLLSFVASSDDPIAGGRHKVFGSLPLLVPPQTSTIASHLPKAVGAALSVGRAKDLKLPSVMPYDAVVMVSFGDASVNHSTAVGAINAASWAAYQRVPMPLVFVCEDNGIGISVHSPPGWVEATYGAKAGLKYLCADGLSLADTYRATQQAVSYARKYRRPVFLHLKMVRLLGHAGSDVETTYHDLAYIESVERQDPLLHSARIIIENKWLSREEVLNLYHGVRLRCQAVAELAITRPKLLVGSAVMETVVPKRHIRKAPPPVDQKVRRNYFGEERWRLTQRPQHLARHLNWSLLDILIRYENTVVFGEDVAQKGGVYNVTTGLWQTFGAKRVFNTLLDEQSILGTAIGMAHNGFLPIPEIQFLAYLHNAEDQLRGEAATLPFFSQGQFVNPMVLRIAGLAYQKGFGGHFHNDNSIAVLRDIPGVIIACPSRGDDAARMLRTCVRQAYEFGRVVVFLEPIALYMTKDLLTTGDGLWSFPYPDPEEEMELGELGVHGEGVDLAIVTYGNGAFLSRQVQRDLKMKLDVDARVVDLRWLAPIDFNTLASEVAGCKAVLIVEECRHTGSLSEALFTGLAEALGEEHPPMRRITAEDSFIPLGIAATSVLPERESIFQAASELIGSRVKPVTTRRRTEVHP